MTLATGLGVVERTQSVRDHIEFVECGLVTLVGLIVHRSVTPVIEAARRFLLRARAAGCGCSGGRRRARPSLRCGARRGSARARGACGRKYCDTRKNEQQ